MSLNDNSLARRADALPAPLGRLAGWVLWLLGYRGVPYMARGTFRKDFVSQIFLSLGMGMVVPDLTRIFALRELSAPTWIVAMLMAEMAGGNFVGSFLAHHLQGRRRVPLVVAARLGIGAVLLGLGLLPATPEMAVPYALILILPALLAAVNLSVQTSIRHANYPDASRGRIYSRFQIVNLAVIAGSVQLASLVLDVWGGAHHLLYPLAGASMFASAWLFAKVRVRSEPMMLREHHASHESMPLLAGVKLFWRDREYGRFMLWQMLSGSTVLLINSLWSIILVRDMGESYSRASLAMTLVPFMVALLAAPLAGALFDRIHISMYRGVGAFMWAAGRGVLYLGVVATSWWWMLLGFAIQGLGRSVGGFAFGIGHTRFSKPGQSQVYMSLHLTLQGLRGLTLPFLGVWLLDQPWIGREVILVGVIVQMIAAAGFALSSRTPPSKPSELPR